MKNSLFKRACAAAVAVPVALAQCISVASAVAADDVLAAAPTQDAVTLESLLAIPAEDDYILNDDGNYEKSSDWNFIAAGVLAQVEGGTIDPARLVNAAAKRGGRYSAKIAAIGEKITSVKYAVDDNGKLTITIDYDNIASAFDVDELSGVDISGKAQIVLGTDNLMGSTSMSIEYSITDAQTGVEYKGAQILGYAQAKIAALKAAGASLPNAEKRINSAISYIDKASERELVKSFDDTAALLAYAAKNEDKLPMFVQNRLPEEMPTSFAEVASKNLVAALFDEIVGQISSTAPVQVNFTADKLGAYADSFKNINVYENGLDVAFDATYADPNASAVASYFISNYDAETVDSWMEVSGSGSFSEITDGVAYVDFQLKRVVSIKEKEPEVTTVPPTTTATTTASTTASTTATTETTATETTATTTVSTTATTETTATETTATTTASTTATTKTTATETTATTTASTTVATETTATETTATETTASTTESTTATTETTATESTTATTASTTASTAAPAETTTVTSIIYNTQNDCEVVPGFYLNIDESYDAAQVTSLEIGLQRQIMTIYENGDKVITNDGDFEIIDLMGKFGFGDQKPSQTIEGYDVMTARDIQLYAAEDIKDSKGNVIIAKGAAIPNAVVKAYVGVKGDINLDGKADSGDASNVLSVYADISTGGGVITAGDIQCSLSPVVTGANDPLDSFALFLADVDNENDANNHILTKDKRKINSSDASFILAMYAAVSTSGGGDLDYRAMWNEVLGDYAPQA